MTSVETDQQELVEEMMLLGTLLEGVVLLAGQLVTVAAQDVTVMIVVV